MFAPPISGRHEGNGDLYCHSTQASIRLNDELRIRCGPFRYRVPLAEIDLVQPSHNPLSSPAASLDRLLIKWHEERRRILISPAPEADFLRELDRRCPQLTLEGDRLVKDSAAA